MLDASSVNTSHSTLEGSGARAAPDVLLRTLRPFVSAVATMFGSNCEVVLHDLRDPEHSIVAIANGHVTGRRLGGPIVGGPLGDVALQWLHEPGEADQMHVYKTQARDGRRLKSTSIVYRNQNGQPVAALCINFDLSGVIAAERLMADLLKIEPTADPQADRTGSTPDVGRILDDLIRDCLARADYSPNGMSRAGRLRALRSMDEMGLFLIRGSVQRVGKALGVSKFSIYSYLDEIRSKGRAT